MNVERWLELYFSPCSVSFYASSSWNFVNSLALRKFSSIIEWHFSAHAMLGLLRSSFSHYTGSWSSKLSTSLNPFPLSSFLARPFISFIQPSIPCSPHAVTPLQSSQEASSPLCFFLSSSAPFLAFTSPSPLPLSSRPLCCSSSAPLPHLSLSGGLSDLPGCHHGNLRPGHLLTEPLGDPVRPL